MSSGEISGLFNADEIEALVQDVPKLRSECVDKSLYEGFI